MVDPAGFPAAASADVIGSTVRCRSAPLVAPVVDPVSADIVDPHDPAVRCTAPLVIDPVGHPTAVGAVRCTAAPVVAGGTAPAAGPAGLPAAASADAISSRDPAVLPVLVGPSSREFLVNAWLPWSTRVRGDISRSGSVTGLARWTGVGNAPLVS